MADDEKRPQKGQAVYWFMKFCIGSLDMVSRAVVILPVAFDSLINIERIIDTGLRISKCTELRRGIAVVHRLSTPVGVGGAIFRGTARCGLVQ